MFVLNIHLVQQLTKRFCSILLNTYTDKRVERATFNQEDSAIGSGV